ncbi:hypothetical protein [Photobacterium damselae]
MKKLAALIGIFFPIIAISTPLKMAEKNYFQQIEYCKQQKRSVGNISDSWFNAQDLAKKKAIIFKLYQHAYQLCYENEEREYAYQAVLLAAESGDKSVLDSIIQLKTPYNKQDWSMLTLDDEKEIQRLSETELFKTPFDLFSVTIK